MTVHIKWAKKTTLMSTAQPDFCIRINLCTTALVRVIGALEKKVRTFQTQQFTLTVNGVYFERLTHSTVCKMVQNMENLVYPGLNHVLTMYLKVLCTYFYRVVV